MKTLILGACLMLGGCVIGRVLERVSGAPPVEMPKESVQREVTARFQQGRPPDPKQLFVCAEVGSPTGQQEFWCLDYFLFQAKLRESEGKTGVTEL